MNYIYDVYLNFSKEAYEFFEWKDNENIEHIRKIPIFKINSKSLYDILYNIVKIEDKYVNLIKNKTEKYNFEILEYVTLLTDGYICLAIKTSGDGKVMFKSKLLIDEEDEIIKIARRYDVDDIKYDVINSNDISFFTKSEKKIRKVLTNEIENAYKNNEYSKLKYLYTEVFDKSIENISKMRKDLLNSMVYYLNDKHINLYKSLFVGDKRRV